MLSLAVLGRFNLCLRKDIAFLSNLWHIFSVRCVTLCKYSILGMITLLYMYLSWANVAFLFLVALMKSVMCFCIRLMVNFGFNVGLSQTPKNLISSFFCLAYILFLSLPMITHLSSFPNLEFMTINSDLAPFILMSFNWKNTIVILISLCACSLLLASQMVSSTNAEAAVLISIIWDDLCLSLCGHFNLVVIPNDVFPCILL